MKSFSGFCGVAVKKQIAPSAIGSGSVFNEVKNTMRIGHFEDIALAESERTGDLGGTGQELTQHTSELKPSQAKEVAQVEEVAFGSKK